MPFSRGSFWPRVQIQVSCIAGRLFTSEPPGKPQSLVSLLSDVQAGAPCAECWTDGLVEWTCLGARCRLLAARGLYCALRAELPQSVWSPTSLNRGPALMPCTGRRSLKQWTTREVPAVFLIYDLYIKFYFAIHLQCFLFEFNHCVCFSLCLSLVLPPLLSSSLD